MVVIPILKFLTRIFPNVILERIYGSKLKGIVVPIIGHITKNQKLQVHKVYNDVVIEIDISKGGERSILFNLYEPTVTEMFLDVIKDGGIVFDVGAWIGYYTLLAAKNADKVVAIEVSDTNCTRIKRNAELNKFSNINVLNVAAGEGSHEGILLEGSASFLHKLSRNGMGKTIRTKSLDEIIRELKVHEVKMLILDIEGYEYYALKGLGHSLSTGIIENLICEIHPKMLRENGLSDNHVIDFLSKFKYDMRYLDKKSDSIPYHIYAKKINEK
jgi:FkbM family methyltransferase